MTDFIPKISESYFNELLHNTGSIEALRTLSHFWGYRIDSQKQNFGLSIPEYFCVITTIYVGHVGNGGHAQFYESRGTYLIPDIKLALKISKCVGYEDVLTKSASPLSNLENCHYMNLNTLDEEVFSFWGECDAELYDLNSIDDYLMEYFRHNHDSILINERA